MKIQTTISKLLPSQKPDLHRLYYPGDIVRTSQGGIGIITEAEICGEPWSDPEAIKQALQDDARGNADRKPDPYNLIPQYSLSAIPGFQAPPFDAWWTSDEWEEVVLGPLHLILDKEKP